MMAKLDDVMIEVLEKIWNNILLPMPAYDCDMLSANLFKN